MKVFHRNTRHYPSSAEASGKRKSRVQPTGLLVGVLYYLRKQLKLPTVLISP